MKHQLEAAGIDVQVFNENAPGGIGELPVTFPELWVNNEDDLGRVGKIIESFEILETPMESILCSGCGVDNPDTFEVCWQCGHTLEQHC